MVGSRRQSSNIGQSGIGEVGVSGAGSNERSVYPVGLSPDLHRAISQNGRGKVIANASGRNIGQRRRQIGNLPLPLGLHHTTVLHDEVNPITRSDRFYVGEIDQVICVAGQRPTSLNGRI